MKKMCMFIAYNVLTSVRCMRIIVKTLLSAARNPTADEKRSRTMTRRQRSLLWTFMFGTSVVMAILVGIGSPRPPDVAVEQGIRGPAFLGALLHGRVENPSDKNLAIKSAKLRRRSLLASAYVSLQNLPANVWLSVIEGVLQLIGYLIDRLCADRRFRHVLLISSILASVSAKIVLYYLLISG